MAGTLPRKTLVNDPQFVTLAPGVPGVGTTATLSVQAVRAPQEPGRSLSGSVVRAALEAREPTVAFVIQPQNGLDALRGLQAVLELQVFDSSGVEPVYTITRDVTGTLLLTRGTVTVSPADLYCFIALLRITNLSGVAQPLQITRRITGLPPGDA